jgi:hypothetical protein
MAISPQQSRWGRSIQSLTTSGQANRWYGYFWEVDATGGNITFTLPAATATSVGSEAVMKTDASANTVTVVPAVGQTINGSAAGFVITTQYDCVTFYNDGSTDIKITSIVSGGGTGNPDNSTLYVNPSNKLAIKPLGITDGLVNGASTLIKKWISTTSYVADQVVIHSGGLWICRVPGLNLTPSITDNNWKQIANIASTRSSVFAGSAITAATYTYPTYQNAAKFDTSGISILVNMPSIASMTNTDMTNQIQNFNLFKIAQANVLTIQLSGADTFTDGTTRISTSAQGLVSLYCIYGTTIWCKG